MFENLFGNLRLSSANSPLADLLGDSEFLSNPMVGLMIGILGTVAVQSSSTFTSIVISIVGAGSEKRLRRRTTTQYCNEKC